VQEQDVCLACLQFLAPEMHPQAGTFYLEKPLQGTLCRDEPHASMDWDHWHHHPAPQLGTSGPTALPGPCLLGTDCTS